MLLILRMEMKFVHDANHRTLVWFIHILDNLRVMYVWGSHFNIKISRPNSTIMNQISYALLESFVTWVYLVHKLMKNIYTIYVEMNLMCGSNTRFVFSSVLMHTLTCASALNSWVLNSSECSVSRIEMNNKCFMMITQPWFNPSIIFPLSPSLIHSSPSVSLQWSLCIY